MTTPTTTPSQRTNRGPKQINFGNSLQYYWVRDDETGECRPSFILILQVRRLQVWLFQVMNGQLNAVELWTASIYSRVSLLKWIDFVDRVEGKMLHGTSINLRMVSWFLWEREIIFLRLIILLFEIYSHINPWQLVDPQKVRHQASTKCFCLPIHELSSTVHAAILPYRRCTLAFISCLNQWRTNGHTGSL
jgi:hypothetical protein